VSRLWFPKVIWYIFEKWKLSFLEIAKSTFTTFYFFMGWCSPITAGDLLKIFKFFRTLRYLVISRIFRLGCQNSLIAGEDLVVPGRI